VEDIMAQIKKAAWLAEGEKLGASASDNCWLIGEWMLEGEEAFLPPMPKAKKARREWSAGKMQRWEKLIAEAASATGLRDSTIKQYARVVRRGVRVKELTFAHHLEVMRCKQIVNNKRKFDPYVAKDILKDAVKKNWTVAQTRAEVSRLFPTSAAVVPNETHLDKAKRLLKSIIQQVPKNEQLSFMDALAQEIPTMKDEVVRLNIEVNTLKPIFEEPVY
jgi:hypothetical protein